MTFDASAVSGAPANLAQVHACRGKNGKVHIMLVSRRDLMKRSAAAVLAGSVPAWASTAPASASLVKQNSVLPDPHRKQVAMLLFSGMTALDLIAPQMVFALLPGRQVHLIAKNLTPIETDTGVVLQPTLTLSDTPDELEILFVPGGLAGIADAMKDSETLAFLESRAATSRYVTSVCTGALILGAAGLLRGYRATTHWAAREVLPLLGAELVIERVVEDRNRITAGGITSGIDFALSLAAKLEGEETAKALQLAIEYAPAPPFRSGTPEEAAPKTVAFLEEGPLFKPFIERWLETARSIQ